MFGFHVSREVPRSTRREATPGHGAVVSARSQHSVYFRAIVRSKRTTTSTTVVFADGGWGSRLWSRTAALPCVSACAQLGARSEQLHICNLKGTHDDKRSHKTPHRCGLLYAGCLDAVHTCPSAYERLVSSVNTHMARQMACHRSHIKPARIDKDRPIEWVKLALRGMHTTQAHRYSTIRTHTPPTSSKTLSLRHPCCLEGMFSGPLAFG